LRENHSDQRGGYLGASYQNTAVGREELARSSVKKIKPVRILEKDMESKDYGHASEESTHRDGGREYRTPEVSKKESVIRIDGSNR